jgi:hypothetical protein
MNRRTNGGLDKSRWLRRDPEAERELLALLDADGAEVGNDIFREVARGTRGTHRRESTPAEGAVRAVAPMELRNR